MATSSNHSEDNVLAYAGVSLLGNKTSGEAPAWHELNAWREGTLSDTRAAEILSHVANDSDVFQQLLDVLEAEQWVLQETEHSVSQEALDYQAGSEQQHSDAASVRGSQPGTASDKQPSPLLRPLHGGLDWLRSLVQQPLPVYGGALAAVILAVLITPLMKSNEASLRQQFDRSSDAFLSESVGLPAVTPVSLNTRRLSGLFDDLSNSDVDRLNYQLGLQRAVDSLGIGESATWQDWTKELPSQAVDCDKAVNSTHCIQAQDDLQVLGQWSLMTYAACQQPQLVDDKYWQAQYEMYDAIAASPHITNSQLFSPLFRGMPGKNPTAMCSIVNQLIAAGS